MILKILDELLWIRLCVIVQLEFVRSQTLAKNVPLNNFDVCVRVFLLDCGHDARFKLLFGVASAFRRARLGIVEKLPSARNRIGVSHEKVNSFRTALQLLFEPNCYKIKMLVEETFEFLSENVDLVRNCSSQLAKK